ncbi:hypothetical protein HYALB_00010078 [Hymenoscyphus albidus]|uniref:Uncharacterized protein n=1 Tax=Hymenoscyphus albidus TaxID=595503 RepID=A0A9N9LH58_9HELO|nr:hypothetical protein HYALB_00010078 [Hymenoscyphus albidus]
MSITPSSTIPPGFPSRPKDFRRQSFHGENHRDIKFLEGCLVECDIENCIFAESSIIACSVDKCISSGGYVSCSTNPIRRPVLRNTTIIDSRIHYADLLRFWYPGIPTEADFSEWDKSLDIFPPEELYLSTDALHAEPIIQIHASNAGTVELVDCEIIGSFIEKIPIASSKIYSGTTTEVQLLHLSPHTCRRGQMQP